MTTEDKKNKEPKNKKRRLVLLDTHAILHRAYHALPEFSSSKGEPTGALYGLVAMLIKIIGELKPDYVVACYDLPGPTYRHEAYEGYKGTRKEIESDLVAQIKRSNDVFNSFHIPVYSQPGFEADDILGTIVEETKNDKDLEIVIASGDMDTLQLVNGEKVKVYTLKKGINDTILYNEKKVQERFGFPAKLLPDYKGLRGDPSDNIIGIKGIGEKTATTLITTFGTIENMYKVLKKDSEPFKKVGITPRIIELLKNNEEEAVFSKMLATIRRDAPISFSLGKPWKESFSQADAEALFLDLDFRTLSQRLSSVMHPETKGSSPVQASFTAKEAEPIDPQELEETTLALWVVDSNFTNPTLDDVLRFAKTNDFKKSKEIIFTELKKRGEEFVYYEIEKPLIPIVRQMEETGVKIDKIYLKELSRNYHKKLDALEKKIWALAGEEFNINSPKQVGNILFDKLQLTAKNMKKTAGGEKSTRESELEKLKELHPIIPLILEYREFQKLLSTYIDNIPSMLDKNDRLHTSLRQAGTTTGRMSSTNPNLQNIPIKTELGRNIRNAFVAEEGYSFVSFDYSQIELRVAAILSGDEKLLEIFRNGEDVHTAVASQVFGVPFDKVDKEMRRKAKVINFGILYGMGVNALKQNLGGTREEAQTFYNDYFAKFEGISKYLDRVRAEATRNGYTETLFGRRRYVEGIQSKIPYIRSAAERMAINAPIQGTATGDIMKLAMKAIAQYIKDKKLGKEVRMLLQIHDELVFEIKDEKVNTVMPEIKKLMESVITPEQSKGVVLVANGEVGKNWGDGVETN
jgi:DNA polymerase I